MNGVGTWGQNVIHGSQSIPPRVLPKVFYLNHFTFLTECNTPDGHRGEKAVLESVNLPFYKHPNETSNTSFGICSKPLGLLFVKGLQRGWWQHSNQPLEKDQIATKFERLGNWGTAGFAEVSGSADQHWMRYILCPDGRNNRARSTGDGNLGQ